MRKNATYLVMGSILLLIAFSAINLISHRHILPQFLLTPSIDSIATTFVNAVVTGNENSAYALTNDTPECNENMRNTLEEFSSFKSAEIEDIITNAYRYVDKPAEELILVFAILNETNGQQASLDVVLKSTYSLLGKRYTCGIDYSHNP